jgi:hypothetical protein
MILIPGVIDVTTNYLEHPEVAGAPPAENWDGAWHLDQK